MTDGDGFSFSVMIDNLNVVSGCCAQLTEIAPPQANSGAMKKSNNMYRIIGSMYVPDFLKLLSYVDVVKYS